MKPDPATERKAETIVTVRSANTSPSSKVSIAQSAADAFGMLAPYYTGRQVLHTVPGVSMVFTGTHGYDGAAEAFGSMT